ncbi:MAG: choice-of-anchor D domain-containing protein [Gemmatimonadales bacterium]|nr:choice-of-anchor D domain-containing protein [Gemmatimonadales bacterium]
MISSYFHRPFLARPFQIFLMLLLVGLSGATASAQDTDQLGIYFDTVPPIQLTGSVREVVISWNAPETVDFGEVTIETSHSLTFLVENTGDGSFTVQPSLPSFCLGFSILEPGLQILEPGDSNSYTIWFEPTAEVPYACTLDMGETIPPIQLIGSGKPPVISWSSPGALDFGEVPATASKNIYFYVENTGEALFSVQLSMDESCEAFYTNYTSVYPIPPGISRSFGVVFKPMTVGTFACTLNMGDTVPPIQLTGSAPPPTISWSAPEALDLGEIPATAGTYQNFLVENTGDAPFTVQLSLDESCSEFSVTPTSLITIHPGSGYGFRVIFQPMEVGTYACTLDLGDTVPPIQLTGSARPPTISWSAPEELDFGEIPATATTSLNFLVVNTGDAPFSAQMSLDESCNEFSANTTYPITFNPGSQYNYVVNFHPPAVGTYACTLHMGDTIPPIQLIGSARPPNISWIAPDTLEFGEGPVGYEQSKSFLIQNTGDAPFTVQLSLDESCQSFFLRSSLVYTIDPGVVRNYNVFFLPTAVESYTCTLGLGETVPPIQVTGSGRPPILSWTAPEMLDFGEVDFGQSVSLPLTVTNTGDVAIYVAYLLEPGCEGFMLTGTTPFTLYPGKSHTDYPTFSPAVLGETVCLLSLGEIIPAVTLIGLSLNEVIGYQITPTEYNFPSTIIGTSRTCGIKFENTGTTPFHIDPVLAQQVEGFKIIYGGEPLDLGLGETHTVFIEFKPLAIAAFGTGLSFGMDFPVVPITGTSEAAPIFDCTVDVMELDFGVVMVGESEARTFQVTNDGNSPLVLDPVENSTSFSVQEGPITIQPGATQSIVVTFQPMIEGIWSSVITLVQDFCPSVVCNGIGAAQPPGTEDLVGFTFNESSLEQGLFDSSTLASMGSIVTAHLALINPSSTDPLSGWECCASIEGPGIFISWQMENNAINVLTAPCFMVGLGSPLPPAPYYILATAQIFVTGFEGEIIFHLGRTDFASIPGEMAWATGGDDPQILPMWTYSGIPQVALITIVLGGPVGVTAPMPSAEVNGGRVTLSWTLDDEEFHGYRVYRREESGSAESLNQQLLPITQGTITFTDDPAGFPSGTILYYSYALAADGVEQARSPEVEVTLKGLPQVTATRLLPNVPNPFNPQTEIPFELKQAGPVRVTIYDVTGRLVRTLVSESLGAGPHSRTWYGQDDRGRQTPSGAYYIRLETKERLDHRKVMLLK